MDVYHHARQSAECFAAPLLDKNGHERRGMTGPSDTPSGEGFPFPITTIGWNAGGSDWWLKQLQPDVFRARARPDRRPPIDSMTVGRRRCRIDKYPPRLPRRRLPAARASSTICRRVNPPSSVMRCAFSAPPFAPKGMIASCRARNPASGSNFTRSSSLSDQSAALCRKKRIGRSGRSVSSSLDESGSDLTMRDISFRWSVCIR